MQSKHRKKSCEYEWVTLSARSKLKCETELIKWTWAEDWVSMGVNKRKFWDEGSIMKGEWWAESENVCIQIIVSKLILRDNKRNNQWASIRRNRENNRERESIDGKNGKLCNYYQSEGSRTQLNLLELCAKERRVSNEITIVWLRNIVALKKKTIC